jgi:DNA-binding MarR family transcriptional regulator
VRHTLQNEPGIMLLATATSSFAGIEEREQAMFDLFRVYTLDALASHECAVLWNHLTGRAIDERQGRALEILTGGSPRLLTMLSRIVDDAPLQTLADDLTRLIDDQTAYFKSQIDALSPQAQRVYVALAEIWSPATAQEIAERARLSVNTVSSVVARLEQEGLVSADAVSRRRKRYQLSERLNNIYYQMRRGGAAAERVRYSVEFLAAYYDADTLVEKLLALAEDTVTQPPRLRVESIVAWFSLYDRIAPSHAGVLLPRLSPDFLALSELSEEQRGRLASDRQRATIDQDWFIDMWVEWWDSHRVLREGWALLRAQPVIGACWDELWSSMHGEAPPTAVGRRIGEQVPAMLLELEQVRPSLHKLCRQSVHGTPSAIDLLVVGAAAGAWFEDEALFQHAWGVFQARWPDSPWVQLVGRWFDDFAKGEHPRRFVREVRGLLARHPDSVWLPLAAGLILDIEGETAAASTFYVASPLSPRLPELARTLVEIHGDFLEVEPDMVMQPRFAKWAGFVAPGQWIAFFVWLGRFTAERLNRPGDAAKVLEIAAEHFPESLELQLALGSALFHGPERADDGLVILRRASKRRTDSWQLGAAIAAVQAYPLGDTEAALRGFAVSWRDYLLARTEEERPSAQAWLEPVSELLPGHQVLRQFLSLLRPGRRKLEGDLKRLLPHKVSRERRQELTLIVIALAMRGDVASLLEQLRRSPAAASLEPLIVGLALVGGEEVQVPHEIAEAARDIAASVRFFAGLHRLVSEGSPA